MLPGICLALLSTVSTVQYLRNEVIDAKQSDYVKTARSKGVPVKKVYSGHIFRNSILPIAAFFGFSITGLFSGGIFVEQSSVTQEWDNYSTKVFKIETIVLLQH